MEVDGEEFDPAGPADDGNPFGTAEAEITWSVDVSPYLAQKRSAMAAHRSQVTDIGFFLEMSPEIFAMTFGTEWFVEPGVESDGPVRAGRSSSGPRRPALPRPPRPRPRGWDDDADPPLDDWGRQQAEAVAAELAIGSRARSPS